MRGVTLEPETVRDFAAEHKIAIGTSFEEAIADPQSQGGDPGDAAFQAPRPGRGGGRGQASTSIAKSRSRSAKRTLSPCSTPVKRAGVSIGVGHHFRLMPSMRVLAELKEAGAFGTIMQVEGNYSHDWLADMPADSWRMQAEESRAGGMTGMGIHVLDCFRDLAGPMKRVSALSKARALKLPTGDTTAALDRIRKRRHGHARHHHQDAVPLAHRGVRRELLGARASPKRAPLCAAPARTIRK